MENVKENERWPKVLSGVFLLGAFLALLIPAGAYWELLPANLASPLVLFAFLSGIAFCFVALVGFLLLAGRKKKPPHELFLLGSLALLLGSCFAYFLSLALT